MLGIDWSHTRDFAIYDGAEAKIVTLSELINAAKTTDKLIIEAGAPVSILYRLCRLCPTFTIDPHRVAELREERGLSKFKEEITDDLVDAQLIYELGNDGARPVTIEDDRLKLAYLYHQFLYMQRAWIKVTQVERAMKRHFGNVSNSTLRLMSLNADVYKAQCEELKETIERIAPIPPPSIYRLKGMSKWLWAGIVITCDPRLFSTKAAYRKYIGLVNRKNIGYRFNRNASRAYWLCADQFLKQRTLEWRDVYDQAKEQLTTRDNYKHPHAGAINRLMTKFANYVFDTVKKEGISVQGSLW